MERVFVGRLLLRTILKAKPDFLRIGLVVACSMITIAAHGAQDPYLGTWVYQKSETAIMFVQPVLTPSGQLALGAETAPETYEITYEALTDGTIKITGHGLVKNGQLQDSHWEWIGKFDGKDYPVTGDPLADARAYTRVDDKTLHVIVKKDGKVPKWGDITIQFKGKKCTAGSQGEMACYRRNKK